MMTLEGQCQKRARHDEVSTPAEDWAKQFQTLICKSTAPIFFNPYCLFLNFALGSWSEEAKPLTYFAAKYITYTNPEYKRLVVEFKYPFVVKHILEVENPGLTSAFKAKASQISIKCDPNIRELWHCTTLESLGSILNSGLDTNFSSIGSFGHGIYFADCIEKANIYSDGKEDLLRLRVLLKCQVILGKSKETAKGELMSTLISNFPGYDSVQGEPRFRREYTVYKNSQVRVTHVFLYNFVDQSMEMDYSGNFCSGLMGNAMTSHAPSFFLQTVGEKADMVSPFVIRPFLSRVGKSTYTPRKTLYTSIEKLQRDQLPLYDCIVPPHQILTITKKFDCPLQLIPYFQKLKDVAKSRNCISEVENLIVEVLSKKITLHVFFAKTHGLLGIDTMCYELSNFI